MPQAARHRALDRIILGSEEHEFARWGRDLGLQAFEGGCTPVRTQRYGHGVERHKGDVAERPCDVTGDEKVTVPRFRNNVAAWQ